jgi:DNA-binding SARP family transcriptional activator/predicted ATPase
VYLIVDQGLFKARCRGILTEDRLIVPVQHMNTKITHPALDERPVIRKEGLQVLLFGEPKILLPDGKFVDFNADKVILLLAYLALNPRRAFSRADLAEVFYPDQARRKALQNIRQVIHRLRKILGDEELNTPAILVDTNSIRINPDGRLTTDVGEVDQIAAAVHIHPHRRLGACRVCMAGLERSSTLYRGDFLDGFSPDPESPLEEWVYTTRTEYYNKITWILHQLASYHFEQRMYDASHADLVKLRTIEPLDEVALRMEMKMLAISGHRSRALLNYHEFQKRLQQVLQLEPEEESILLAEQIRDGELAPGMGICRDDNHRLHIRTTGLLFNNHIPVGSKIPDFSLPFFGRSFELSHILNLLDSRNSRVIAVKGSVASGKTRLALQAVRESAPSWRDGVYLVALDQDSIRIPDLETAFIRSLGLSSSTSSEHRKNLINFLRDKEVLILIDHLDNFNHQAELIASLVNFCPQIKVLITSRKQPAVRAASILELHGLAVPSEGDLPGLLEYPDLQQGIANYGALELFQESARRIRQDFAITGKNLADIAMTCELLLGLPGAVEIAAYYTRHFPCGDIHEGLAGALQPREGQTTFINKKNSFFREQFSAVWDSLSSDEKRLVKRLSPGHGGIFLEDLLAERDVDMEMVINALDQSTLIRLPDRRIKVHPLVQIYTQS